MDVVLRGARTYTALRRATLAASVLTLVGVPLWHLHNVDAPLLGPPGAVDVLGLQFVDPLALAVAGKLSLVVLPGALLIAVLGRFFCGWICPYVPLLAASNALRWWLERLGFKPLDVKLPRRTSWAVMLAVLLFGGSQWLLFLYPPSVIGREVFHAVYFGGLTAGALAVVGAFTFDTFLSRAGFCRSVCPGGAMYSVLGALSPITVRVDRDLCTDCTACDVICNLGQSPMTGRVDEGCERCGKCIASCPTKALRFGR
jgi:ferredoxin-type protein NapH